ncbi:MAG: MFS transporter [Chloroflexota bacterium]|nr:MFS transporter [Chloroflexota bacterium]
MSLFRSRGFLLLWSGQLLVTFASWALRTVLLIWVYGLAHSGVAVSIVGLAEAAPLLLLAPIGGVLVDRWHRAFTMAGATLLSAVLLLPLLTVTTVGGLPLIIIVAVLANAAVQLFMTAAGAAIPVVAGQEQVAQANSFMSLLNGGVAVLAPGLAALLFSGIGPHGAILVLGLVFFLAVPILALVPAARVLDTGAPSTSVRAEMFAGLGYVIRSRLLLSLVAMAAIAGLGFGALSVLDVVFVTRALHLRSDAVGLLLSASGLGELAGGIAMSVIANRIGRWYHLLLGISVIISGSALVAYSIANSLLVAALVLSVVGLMFPPIIVSFVTMQQRVTEDAFMGRVNSIVNTAMGLMMLLSLIAGGALTDLLGVRRVIAGGAAVLLASGVVSLLLIRSTPVPRTESAERDVQAGLAG